MFLIEDVEYKRIHGGCIVNNQNQKPSDVVFPGEKHPHRFGPACPSYPRKEDFRNDDIWRWVQPRPFYPYFGTKY